ncbi:BTAD domain-containing putative transcriptional regulator [Streptomyces sp. NPDC051105]|uniref:BTAD domain-containing putative transcriptional regulator n=1 Tax=Streptomyces sp. NPDC051105 TaxID=3154843 RepID=UPI00344080FD
MKFGVLGPLEVKLDAGTMALGGIKPRALLGYLLLNPNRVVSTTQLLSVIWAGNEPPLSARKILQNAVSHLRSALSSHGAAIPGEGALLTQAPGYTLSLDEDLLDLRMFQRLADEGRRQLAAGKPEDASSLLGEALALWRGPVLADLAEAGIVWPEMDIIANSRLDTFEDFFEAEIACGRHQQILSQLEEVANGDNLRERACRQLMLALYRSGRQVDALEFYGRVRTTLTEEFGLEPGRDLQELQQAILTHDASLMDGQRLGLASTGDMPVTPSHHPEGPGAPLERDPVSPATSTSLLAVRWHRQTLCTAEQEAADQRYLLDRVRTEVLRFGGVLVEAESPGLILARFTTEAGADDCAQRAVLAALGLRTLGATEFDAGPGGPPISVCVLTGEDNRPQAAGETASRYRELVARCTELLATVPVYETYVCRTTRLGAGTAASFSAVAGHESSAWRLLKGSAGDSFVVLERETELDLLWTLAGHVRKRSRAHLVTVVGEPGVGKTQLVMAFEERLRRERTDVTFLMGGLHSASEPSDPLAVPSGVLASFLGGFQPGETWETSLSRLREAVSRTVADGNTADMVGHLTRLLPGGPGSADPVADTLAAWQTLLESIADDRPLIVAMDNLEQASDEVLDFVEMLAETATAKPLLLIAIARPELLRRRPTWGGGRRRASTIHLDPLSDAALDDLWGIILSSVDTELKQRVHLFLDTLPPALRTSPCLRRGFVRMALLLTPWRRAVGAPLQFHRSIPHEMPLWRLPVTG